MSGFVQKATQNSTTTATCAVSFSVLPTAGNQIVVEIAGFAGSVAVSGVADNQGVGNSYVVANDGTRNASGTSASGSSIAAVYWCSGIGATSGTFTVTVTLTGSSFAQTVNAIEANSVTAVDDCNSTSWTVAKTSLTLTGAAANAGATDLVVAVLTLDTGSASSAITDPPTTSGSGTYASDLIQNNGSAFVGGEAAHKTTTGVETSDATWTSFASAADGAAAIASFKIAAGIVPLTGIQATFATGILTVAKPTISIQPKDVLTVAGTTPSFSVTAAASAGGGSLTYQWQDNSGGSFANVSGGSGATTATYTTASTTIGFNGRRYRCVVNDNNGQTLTYAAELQVVTVGTLGIWDATLRIQGWF